MPKNLFSTIDWWGERPREPIERVFKLFSSDFLRLTFNVLRSTHHASRITLLLTTIAFAFTASLSRADDKITYNDHILPLVEANCSKCHNADKKKADLDLTSYQGALKGSGSGAVLISGNLDGSKLWKAVTHAEEPNMPPNRPKLEDKDLDLFKKWIMGGLLETATGKAVAATAAAVDLSLKADAVGKPDGPPPMPAELPVVPVVHTTHLNAITGLASSPWAPLIAVAGQKQLLLFNSESRDLLGILPFTEGQPADVKFSRSGQLLLANGGRGARSGRVVIWEVVTGKRMTTLGDDYDTILTSDIRLDQSQVAVGSPSRLVKIFSTKTGELQHKIKKHTDWVTAIAFSPNGQMLATADRNGGISIWDPDNAQELFTLAGHKSSVTVLSWRGDSKLLASSSEDGTVKLWEMQEGKQFKNWNAHGPGALCVNYSHDGRLVTCGRDNNVTLWDANGGKVRSITTTNDLPLRVTFSHDDSTIFASDFSGHITAYATKDGKLLGELDANPSPPSDKSSTPKRVAASR
jgi:WD40 repeat protein